MLDFIRSIRGKRSGRLDRDSSSVEGASDLPLDHRLTFEPDKEEKWTFERDGVYVNGVLVDDLVNDGKKNRDVALLCGASRGLQEYQLFVWSKGGKTMAGFNARVQSLQDKVHGILAHLYDALTGGVDLDLSDGDAWLNNVSVRKMIQLYIQNPTVRRRQYLMGLKDKLALILSRRRSNSIHDAVRTEAEDLLEEIDIALDFMPASAPLRLVGGGGRV